MVEGKCLPRAHETQVRAPRVGLGSELTVEAKTIGTNLTFPLRLENLSRSGMLLVWESDFTVPFRENTIIEMRIDPAGQVMARPIYCLGKVVRRSGSGLANRPRFGIRIVQIDDGDLQVWETVVNDLERKIPRAQPSGKFRLFDGARKVPLALPQAS